MPATLEELVTLPGVGRKTANLVLILAFKSQREHLRRHPRAPHLQPAGLGADAERRRRPSRRSTRTLEQRWWPLLNLYLVTWGQNVCRPVYPRCGDCAIAADCPRIGVARSGAASRRRDVDEAVHRSARDRVDLVAVVASARRARAAAHDLARRGPGHRRSKPRRARSSSRPIPTKRRRRWRTSSSW